ncbi:MAG: D-alanyl-D-alanine endopeptidase [Burkholderiaceae bacterium]|nr:D-alanyl-D-alanine endopeptidase [Burkholderiaceae bacterium]MEB2317775.1 D-alanyl-D-alanine endopeptidase [Pseudomonadota bacterium]
MLGSWFRAAVFACVFGALGMNHPEIHARGAAAEAGKSSSSAKRQTAKAPRSAGAKAQPRKAGAKASQRRAGARAQPKAQKTTKPRRQAAAASRKSNASVVKTKASRTARAQRAIVAPTPTIGEVIGLRRVHDPLDLGSSVALMVDARSGRTLYEKNADAVLPIASISKLMTAMVVIDSKEPMHEMLTISSEDVDTERNSSSRLTVGTKLSRAEMLQLALMASENRAANALGRHHPGGLPAFVAAMNRKAQAIGMNDSSFVEPTGLSVANVANAHDLVKLVREAARYPLLRSYSTSSDLTVDTGFRQVRYGNTNRLVKNEGWEIGLQKTGYISEAGRCLVMQTLVDGRPVVMVLLDSDGSNTRFGDARRLRTWLEAGGATQAGSPSANMTRTASSSS